MKKPVIILSSLLLCILLLTVLQAVVSNSISTSGIDLSRMQQEIAKYKKENTLLSEKILQASSFLTISEEAEKMGYVESHNAISMNDAMPLAYSR